MTATKPIDPPSPAGNRFANRSGKLPHVRMPKAGLDSADVAMYGVGPRILNLARITAAYPAGENNPAVLWVFRDYEDRWCVRAEGGEGETAFRTRDEALAFARIAGRAGGSYRLFFELKDGRVTQEFFNLGARTRAAAIR